MKPEAKIDGLLGPRVREDDDTVAGVRLGSNFLLLTAYFRQQ